MEILFRTQEEATAFGEAYIADDEDVTGFTVTPSGKSFRVDFTESDGYVVNQKNGACSDTLYL